MPIGKINPTTTGWKVIKLSKTSWLLLLVGVFTIAFAGLGLVYSKQSSEQGNLTQELSQAQLILAKSSPTDFSTQRNELENKIAQAQSEMEEVKATLSFLEESIEASDSIFAIAETCSVSVAEVRTSAPSGTDIKGVGYFIIPLTVRLEGDIPNILQFVLNWTESHPTGEVKSVQLSIPGMDSVGEAGEEVGETGEEEADEEEVGEIGEEEADEEEVGETGEEEADEEEETGGSVGEIETEPQKPEAAISLLIYTYRGG
ncbi:hypothetical protein ACFLYE_03785 [Chloroflexota bacterium]